MTQTAEEVMDLVYEQLSPKDIDSYQKEIAYLPDVLRDDTLEGITIGKMPGGKVGLIISTDDRIICFCILFGQVNEVYKASYDEIEALSYSGGKLEAKKKKGLFKSQQWELRSEKPSEQFLNILRQRIPVLVDVPQPQKLSNRIALADNNVVSSEKASSIDRALRSLSVTEAKYSSRGEIKALANILWEDELPEAIVSGTYHKGNGLLVITDRRLIFIDKGFVGLTVEDFYFEDISSIETHKGWLTGSLTVYSRGNKENIENVPGGMRWTRNFGQVGK